MRVEYHPAIEQELREIIDYYNRCSHGLGIEFLNEFERQVLNIVAMPLQWQVVEDDIRRALMRRFPYLIYFRVGSIWVSGSSINEKPQISRHSGMDCRNPVHMDVNVNNATKLITTRAIKVNNLIIFDHIKLKNAIHGIWIPAIHAGMTAFFVFKKKTSKPIKSLRVLDSDVLRITIIKHQRKHPDYGLSRK